MALSTLMGWNQRLEDWGRLMELSPSGSFVARDHDRVVGTAIGIDYVHCGWFAMMLASATAPADGGWSFRNMATATITLRGSVTSSVAGTTAAADTTM